eukprot:gene12036-biopygen3018
MTFRASRNVETEPNGTLGGASAPPNGTQRNVSQNLWARAGTFRSAGKVPRNADTAYGTPKAFRNAGAFRRAHAGTCLAWRALHASRCRNARALRNARAGTLQHVSFFRARRERLGGPLPCRSVPERFLPSPALINNHLMSM